MASLYAISDIHGRYDLLKDIIDTHIHFEQNDKLVLLGDYVDGQYAKQSYQTLDYIYHLQQKYPDQVYVLCGNHDYWLSCYLNNSASELETTLSAEFETLQSFIDEDEFNEIYNHAMKTSDNRYSILDSMYISCRNLIYNRYTDLIQWLSKLPYYLETENQIYVHAGIVQDEKYWKELSTINTYLMKYPPEYDSFYKTVIAGHISTYSMSQSYRIYRYKDNIYLDSSVEESKCLNLLKYNFHNHKYTGIIKEGYQWIEYELGE